jgi:hypothetical protein
MFRILPFMGRQLGDGARSRLGIEIGARRTLDALATESAKDISFELDDDERFIGSRHRTGAY